MIKQEREIERDRKNTEDKKNKMEGDQKRPRSSIAALRILSSTAANTTLSCSVSLRDEKVRDQRQNFEREPRNTESENARRTGEVNDQGSCSFISIQRSKLALHVGTTCRVI